VNGPKHLYDTMGQFEVTIHIRAFVLACLLWIETIQVEDLMPTHTNDLWELGWGQICL
jgi:hypothetical protein